MSKVIAKLKINQPTWLKRSVTQASFLPETDKLAVTPDRPVIDVLAHRIEAGHVFFTMPPELASQYKNLNSWYAFGEHVELQEVEDRKGEDAGAISFKQKPTDLGRLVQVPGLSAGVYLNTPIGRSRHFFWYEALHGGSRIPDDWEQTRGIIQIAEALQSYRDRLGRSFHITSWLRPKAINDAVGGAKFSTHLLGKGVDFYVDGMTTRQLYDWFNRAGWFGGLGTYPGMSIVHTDCRGYQSRW